MLDKPLTASSAQKRHVRDRLYDIHIPLSFLTRGPSRFIAISTNIHLSGAIMQVSMPF